MPVTYTNPSFSFVERLVEIARAGGEAAIRFYGPIGSVDQKADGSPVTAADVEAHAVIVTALSRWDPSIPVISEEGAVPPYEQRRQWRRFWLVDPLDGTKEFLAGNGEFTINIALIEDAEPVFGVVVAPALKTTYLAGRDIGAWRSEDGRPTARLAGVPNPNGPVRIVESRSHPSPRLEEFIATLGPVQRIRLGSSLKFCRVAEGAADLYPRFGRTMEWDVAAGDCIYRNAGANGYKPHSPFVYNTPSLSSNEFVIGEARPR
jgi:3'(2'), 5'-bisphosphate nucleotidase